MSPEEFIQMMNELPDDIIEAANTPPVRKNIKIRYIIPAAAACIVILIAAAIYPKLKTQTPAILPESSYSEETTAAPPQTDTQTSTEQTDASAVSGTTHIRSESAVQTTGTTVRTSVTTVTGTAQTSATVTTRETAAGTAHNAVTGTARTTSRTRITQTTKQTAVTTRRTTARTTETRRTTTSRTTARTTQTTPDQTTHFPEQECTTVEIETTVAYPLETTRAFYTISVPVFRSETEAFPITDGNAPGQITASFSAVRDDEILHWQQDGLIPPGTDLSGYDLIRVDMSGEGKAVMVRNAQIIDGQFIVVLLALQNKAGQQTAYSVKGFDLIAVPKEYGITPEKCISYTGYTNQRSLFEWFISNYPNDITITVYL